MRAPKRREKSWYGQYGYLEWSTPARGGHCRTSKFAYLSQKPTGHSMVGQFNRAPLILAEKAFRRRNVHFMQQTARWLSCYQVNTTIWSHDRNPDHSVVTFELKTHLFRDQSAALAARTANLLKANAARWKAKTQGPPSHSMQHLPPFFSRPDR